LFLYRSFLFFSVANFPKSQARAEAAVAKTRIEDPASDAAPWTTQEYITALSARVTCMIKLGKLPDAAIRAFKCLWPGEKVPNHVDAIGAWLMECGARLNEWRRSARMLWCRHGSPVCLLMV
jgi:hypothetical protein